MEKLIDTEAATVVIQVDITNQQGLLFAVGHAVQWTDGTTTVGVVGLSGNNGYAEGVGDAARFKNILGFVQLNRTSMIVTDYQNNCLRTVDRPTRQTSVFVGECQSSGEDDGRVAKFDGPSMLIKDFRDADKLLLVDRRNHAVRQIDIITRITTTLVPRSAGLQGPRCLVYDALYQSLIICEQATLSKYNLRTKTRTIIVDGQGFADGALADANVDVPRGAYFFSEDIFLLVDKNNHRLRLVNLRDDSVSSICTGANSNIDGPASSCARSEPRSLLVYRGKVYVGQSGAISIMPCELPLSLCGRLSY